MGRATRREPSAPQLQPPLSSKNYIITQLYQGYSAPPTTAPPNHRPYFSRLRLFSPTYWAAALLMTDASAET
ncbi:hypothetical protein NDU88_003763 [Pleurodeles waltl]|uniref:Uncharacterized protein n=1 Tax=Pleurodeles waltl TaxID=8319 RepID=A0AAV7V2F2_PLEWA|nr:hypothetical protein NDU88_003763 [Pleurodeles waltl]